MFSIEYVCYPEVGGPQMSPASRLIANLRIIKFCYISGPSANVPFCGFVNYELGLFRDLQICDFANPICFVDFKLLLTLKYRNVFSLQI